MSEVDRIVQRFKKREIDARTLVRQVADVRRRERGGGSGPAQMLPDSLVEAREAVRRWRRVREL